MSKRVLVLSVGAMNENAMNILYDDFIEKIESLGMQTEKIALEDDDGAGFLESDTCMRVMDVLLQQDGFEEVFEKLTRSDYVVLFTTV